MVNQTHNFIPDDAKKFGITKAVVLYTLRNWINYKNKIKKGLKKAKNGKQYYFAYASSKSLQEQMPYFSKATISRSLSELEKDGVIISGIFNKIKWDKTKWYALTELQIVNIDNSKCDIDKAKRDIDKAKRDDNTISFDISSNISSSKKQNLSEKQNISLLGKENNKDKKTSKKPSFFEGTSSKEKNLSYEPCYDDGTTYGERRDFFANRRRKAVDVAKQEGMTAEDFLDKMSKTKDLPAQIIHAYITHKKMTFENNAQLFNEFQRNLKTAHKLKCYTLERIKQTFSILDGKDFEWTLETVEKKINEYRPKKETKRSKFYW